MSALPQQTSAPAGPRPREVTLGGIQAVAGSVLALVLLISTAQQLNGAQMTDTLTDIVKNEQVAALDLSVDNARRLLRYTIMAMSVLSAASLVLGVFVLRRHRASRIALSVLGGVVAIVGLIAGPVGWIGTVYVGVSIFLLWSRAARAWFSDDDRASGRPRHGPGRPGGPPSGSGGSPTFGPPTGPRRDVDGTRPPPNSDPAPPASPEHSPPPPPPPRRR